MDWDEELPDDLKAKWSTLLNNLKNTSAVEFPRRYVITTIEDPVQCRREWGGGGLSPPNNFLTSGVFYIGGFYILFVKYSTVFI